MKSLKQFNRPLLSILLISFLLLSCSLTESEPESEPEPDKNNAEWLIPKDEVVDGGPGKDGIPSIDDPKFSSVAQADYVLDERLVLGIKIGDQVKLYPHQVMDWHEIVNDKIGNQHYALTYCPLTGTGITYERETNGELNEFGVSGLLFRNNLIMYDRNTDSRWSQMQIRSVNGALKGTQSNTIQTVEATWEAWKELYPEADVITTETGFNRNYQSYAYRISYPTNHDLFLFPPKRIDDRLKNKTIVHGIMPQLFIGEETQMRIYPIENFSNNIEVIEEEFDSMNLVIAGSAKLRIAVSFSAETEDGTLLDFSPVQNNLPIIMEDNEGNEWNIFGEAMSGPRVGEKLLATQSFNGYWFAFADFYQNSCIYPNNDC